VIQEIRNIIADNQYIFDYQINKYLFPKYAYQYDYIEHIKFIKKYDISKIIDFINNHVIIQNMVISVSCPNNSLIKTQKIINKYFDNIKNKSHKRAKIIYPIYHHKNKQLHIVAVKNSQHNANSFIRLYVCKKIEYLSNEYLCLILLKEILFNFDTGVFYNTLRKEYGLIYNIDLNFNFDRHNPKSSHYYIHTSTEYNNIPNVIYLILEIIKNYSITDDDIQNARNSILFKYEKMKFHNLTSYNKHYEQLLLHNKPIIELSSICKKYQNMKNSLVRRFFQKMKDDILNHGILFYYSNKIMNKAIRLKLSNNYKYKLHKIEK